MTAWGSLTDRILLCMKEHGPMPAVEIAQHIGSPNAEHVGKICRRLVTQRCGNGPLKGKLRAYISGWRHDAEGVRRYPRPVYAFGQGKNQPKPEHDAEAKRAARLAYLRMRSRQAKLTSVFSLGAFGAAVLSGARA